MRNLFFVLTFLFLLPFGAHAQNSDWSTANTMGLYNTAEEGQLNDNIWKGYTLDKAVRTVSLMPHTLRSPAYRNAARKLLLSSAPPIDNSSTSPALLSARLQKLIDYGLLDEANTLYQQATQDIPADYNLALIGIQMILAEGDLAPACLDIQASGTLFRDIDAWRDLTVFCRTRFGTEGSNRNHDYRVYPSLNRLVSDAPISLSTLTSATETFIAFADNKISAQLYNASARNMGQLSDLFITLALSPKFAELETHSCYAIEATVRGIKDIDYLSKFYAAQNFNADDLQGKNSAVSMHPCAVPAFFYQRLSQEGRSASEMRQDINLLLDVSDSLSPYALAPVADQIIAYYTPDTPGMDDWHAALAVAAAGKAIPEGWATTTDGESSMPAMAMPLYNIQNANQINQDAYLQWVQTLSVQSNFVTPPMDYGLPLYYSQSVTGEFNKLENRNTYIDYEKLFSLTYSKKYLHSSLGTIDAMALALKSRDVPGLLTIALATAGKHQPGSVDPQLIAGILATLEALKLEKEKQVLAFDALH